MADDTCWHIWINSLLFGHITARNLTQTDKKGYNYGGHKFLTPAFMIKKIVQANFIGLPSLTCMYDCHDVNNVDCIIIACPLAVNLVNLE